jgi:glycine cleavage system H protein
MPPPESQTTLYKRATFVTSLPVARRYSPSHCWVENRGEGIWRVGFTKFATRMLGEMVDHRFDATAGLPVKSGDVVGWIEGFKAISDLFCVVNGAFVGGNSALASDIELVTRDGYHAGWLYEVRGEPDALCVDVHGYRELLDKTIDRILEKQKAEETPD